MHIAMRDRIALVVLLGFMAAAPVFAQGNMASATPPRTKRLPAGTSIFLQAVRACPKAAAASQMARRFTKTPVRPVMEKPAQKAVLVIVSLGERHSGQRRSDQNGR